jgi:hypothetical protein
MISRESQPMNFAEEISRIRDALIYVRLYAPEFPSEDRKSVAEHGRWIIEHFDAIAPLARGATRQKWLSLSRQEIVAAFDVFASDAHRTRRHLEEAVAPLQRLHLSSNLMV